MKRAWMIGVAAGLVSCGNLPPILPDTAQLPASAQDRGSDPDMAAAEQAQQAFADASRTYGRPIEAARAAASLDYLAGEIYTSPRWSNIDPGTKEELLEGRQELREALGVSPVATSQEVVDRLTAASNALAANDQASAERALGAPVFPAGGEKTLATLANMPYLRIASVATQHLNEEMVNGNSEDRF